jgi:formylglycine-generating enzyme required for sulfatase activity
VAALRPNIRGLFDVHGNVKEWCEDAFSPYGVPPTQLELRVVRGGGGSAVETCRSAARDGIQDPDEYVGFRLCVDLPAGE